MNYDRSIVTTDKELAALESDWNKLVDGSDCTIFQTFEWIQAWWKYFGAKRLLRCITFRSGSELVGVAPLFSDQFRLPFVHPFRYLRFMGAPISDYHAILAKSGHEVAVTDALFAYLLENQRDWDVFELESVNEASPWFHRIVESVKAHNWPLYLYQGSVSAQVDLPSTFEEFLNKQDKQWRHEYRRKWNRIRQAGEVKIEQFGRPEDDLASPMESFFEIHGNRWKSVGYPSEFDKKEVRDFHLDIASRFAHRDWLSLGFLTIDNARLAFSLDFLFRNRVYVYQSQAFGSPELMKYSPGFLIKMSAIERAIAGGLSTYDLLRGDFGYKFSDFDASPSKNWLIRTRSPGQLKIRFLFFLAYDFANKSWSRILREYYEFRRFKATRKSSSSGTWKYLLGRFGVLFQIGLAYLGRHLLKRQRADLKNNAQE